MAPGVGQKWPVLLTFSLICFFELINASAPGLVVSKLSRNIDLQGSAVRQHLTIKVENVGVSAVSEVLLGLQSSHLERLALSKAAMATGKGKARTVLPLDITVADTKDANSENSLLAVKLNKPLQTGETAIVEVYLVFSGLQKPFPTHIFQSEPQLMLYTDSHFALLPYVVKSQTTTIRLPSARVEAYTKREPSKHTDSELKFGPYEDVQPGQLSPLSVHFEHNRPFVVVDELVKEIEISHWGNIYITENYRMHHAGAVHKGAFSRLEFQSRPGASGVAAARGLLGRLPAGARSVYYRDEIGNISTSHLRHGYKQTELELEPRYPLFGGWSASFTLGYSLPLEDFVFKTSDGRRALNISFGSPFNEVNIESFVVKVVLPEGSTDIIAQLPLSVEQSRDVKYTYLDTVGRPVVILKKGNLVPEHNALNFQVLYRFSGVALLAEPLLLITAFLAFFVACMVYVRLDFTISKNTPSYQARIQKEQVADFLQRLQKVISSRATVEERLVKSLIALGRNGDTAAAKLSRKSEEARLKLSDKELKTITDGLEAGAHASAVLPKVFALVSKEKELQEKVIQKHTVTVDAYERKLPLKEIDLKVAPIQQKIASLKGEVKLCLLLLED